MGKGWGDLLFLTPIFEIFDKPCDIFLGIYNLGMGTQQRNNTIKNSNFMNHSFAVHNRIQIADIKRRYLSGQITREQAKQEAAPVIERINLKGAEVSKRWKRKFSPQTFIGLMR